jgi:hypothetical protein
LNLKFAYQKGKHATTEVRFWRFFERSGAKLSSKFGYLQQKFHFLTPTSKSWIYRIHQFIANWNKFVDTILLSSAIPNSSKNGKRELQLNSLIAKFDKELTMLSLVYHDFEALMKYIYKHLTYQKPPERTFIIPIMSRKTPITCFRCYRRCYGFQEFQTSEITQKYICLQLFSGKVSAKMFPHQK